MIKVLKETAAPVNGSYREFSSGKVYGPDTYPATTPELETQAIKEGWALSWEPEDLPAPLTPEKTTDLEAGEAPASKSKKKKK